MAFYGYKGDVGECHWTPYNPPCDYEFSASARPSSCEFEESKSNKYFDSYDYYDYDSPAQVNYSVYSNSQHNLVQYEPIEYFDYSSSSSSNYYDAFESRFGANYSVYNYSGPKLVQYTPPTNARVYLSSVSKSDVSNSTSEFNEIEFDEYDPTPYSGGYDPSKTYGSPLPPSDEICYPRPAPLPDGASLEGFSYASIPSPYGENDKQIDVKTDPQPHGENGEKIAIDGVGTKKVGDLTDAEIHGENGDKLPTDGVSSEIGELDVNQSDELPSCNHINGFEDGQIERQIPQMSYGSGLECIDLCESLFGYWPCLAKRDQRRDEFCPFCDHGRRRDPWDGAADYLFGTTSPYNERDDGGYQSSVYNYGDNYHVEQPQYVNSWLH